MVVEGTQLPPTKNVLDVDKLDIMLEAA